MASEQIAESPVVSGLLDTLIERLHLAFVVVRVNNPKGGPVAEMIRVPEGLSATVAADCSAASVRLGLRGEAGIAVAGASRPGFPSATDRLFLETTANRAALAVQQSWAEREARVVVDSMPGLVAILTPTGEVAVVNDQLAEYSGQPLETMKDWSTNGTVHPDDVPRVVPIFTRAIASGSSYDFEARIRRFDGVYRWFRVRGRPLRDQNLQVVRWYVLLIDIDPRKLAEEALSKARSELAYVSRLTTASALTASIAHELNQPLTGIITNASTCLRMLDGATPDIEGALETARRMIRDSHRAADVIARLRALFSKREFTLEPLDLNDAVREVVAITTADLQRNRIAFHTDLAADLPMITGDRIQIQQVILNLLRNASDALTDVVDRPRLVMIRTQLDQTDQVRLTVQDSGVGLSAESTQSLFDAFYTTKTGGMGIGLFVSRSIIERHSGRLWAEPNDGPGAAFSFAIPRAT